MSSKYPLNKVPLEEQLDARYPAHAHNERYLNRVDQQGLGDKVFGHASKPIDVDPAPNYDIGRVQWKGHNYGNTPDEAFDYEY